MKKIICILLSVILFAGAFSACGKKESEVVDDPAANASAQQSNETSETTAAEQTKTADTGKNAYDVIDVDLTKLSSTMIYSVVLNMVQTPDNYLGKVVKMSGNFATTENTDQTKRYFACIIPDATACCSQGIEFVLDGDYYYPLDYPELNSEITVTGVFDTYMEGDYQYCQLLHAVLG